jgi:hypothetical protein
VLTCSVDLSDFDRAVARTQLVVRLGISNAVRIAAIQGAEEAKRVGLFKDRTHRLRTGIVARFVSDSGGSVTWEMLSPMFYSRFVNDGTSRARPYPFMTPGAAKAERVLNEEGNKIPAAIARVWA